MSMWCNRKNLVPKNVSCLKKGEILNKTPDQLVWHNRTLVLFNSKKSKWSTIVLNIIINLGN